MPGRKAVWDRRPAGLDWLIPRATFMGLAKELPAYRCVVKMSDFTASKVFKNRELVIGDFGKSLPSLRQIRAWQVQHAPWDHYNGRTQYSLAQWAYFAHFQTSALVLVPGDQKDYFVVQPLDMNVRFNRDRNRLFRSVRLLTDCLPRRGAPKELASHLGRGILATSCPTMPQRPCAPLFATRRVPD